MKKPFVYGELATKDNFIDRQEDRKRLKTFLQNGINVMLISPRRWGKSSLVKMAMEEVCATQTILLVDTNAPVFEADVDGLTVSQVNMLIAIANGESHFNAQDVNRKYSLGAPQTVSRNKQTLTKKDIIERNGDVYTFVDPIFKFWFKKNHHA